MELFRTFTIVLGLAFFLDESHVCQAVIDCSQNEVHNVTMYRLPCKYGKARTQYYANCTATYQMLLKSGDIHPNPGPQTTGQKYQHNDEVCTLQKDRICYDTEYLRSLNPNPHIRQYQRLPNDIWNRISDLGISKRKKTRRGKGSKVLNTDLPCATGECTIAQQQAQTTAGKNVKARINSVRQINVHTNSRFLTQEDSNTARSNANLIHVTILKEKHKTRFSLWNARSLKSKGKSISMSDFVIQNRVDVLAITETWLTNSDKDNISLASISNTLPGHEFIHSPRLGTTGGGVGILVRKGFTVTRNESLHFRSFEYLDVTLKTSSTGYFRVVVIYRPPPSTRNKLSPSIFFDEFSSLLEVLQSRSYRLLLTGDFNLHVDNPENATASTFLDLLSSADLKNFVNVPTHKNNHTLDLIISKTDGTVTNISICQALPSDHYAILCDLHLKPPPPQRETVRCRAIQKIDIDSFVNDIASSILLQTGQDDCNLEELCSNYNRELEKILDNHAPVKDKTFTVRHNTPWYTKDLRNAKQERRRLERRANKQNALQIDKDLYKSTCTSRSVRRTIACLSPLKNNTSRAKSTTQIQNNFSRLLTILPTFRLLHVFLNTQALMNL